ncbi:hypothetical protein [Halomonas sp. C05BenzN]|uniref:hypothetical protein n=1 Tax=Halomonas sp. C05BenzN TaxID=3411041 RepID=UPI003B92FE42
MKRVMAVGLSAILLSATADARAFDDRVTLGAIAGTTGLGADISWRFHDRFGVSAQYAGGLDWDGDHDTDDVTYDGDLSLSAGALKLDFYPFAGRFYLTAGAMLPDMEANVTGRPKDGGTYTFNGREYDAEEVGALHGKLTIADGVRPYAGLGWRSSHRSGFGFFSEFGVMATSIDVSLRASNEGVNSTFQEDLRREEQRLKDEADELPFYPVAMVGISYTF